MAHTTALTTRVLYPDIRPDKHPKWVREAVAAACSHSHVDLYILPDVPRNRNQHRIVAIWNLQDSLEQLGRFYLQSKLYRSTKDRNYKPCLSKKQILVRLGMAWRTYQEWDYG